MRYTREAQKQLEQNVTVEASKWWGWRHPAVGHRRPDSQQHWHSVPSDVACVLLWSVSWIQRVWFHQATPCIINHMVENYWCHGGCINGGVVLFKPSVNTFDDMQCALKTIYQAKDKYCAEQDYFSWYYGVHHEGFLVQLDLAFNFQIHQLSFSAPSVQEDGR